MLAYAEDHAALVEALVTMAEVDDVAWLEDARAVADALLDLFQDPEHGGFFTTGRDADHLIVRAKDLFDNATPSENSLAADGLLRLAAVTGDQRYADAGVAALRLVHDAMARQPTAFAHALGALERYLTPALEVAVVGPLDDPATTALRAEAWRRHLPASVRVTAGPGVGASFTPLLEDRPLVDGRPTAFVCERFACKLPVTDAGALAAQIDEALAH